MIAAYCVLHYGKEWLAWAIRSILSDVDVIYVVYTSRPSFGFQTDISCPETREELRAICQSLGSKVQWVDTGNNFCWEGEHRTYAANLCKQNGAEAIVVLDADEIWPAGLLPRLLAIAREEKDCDVFGINMMHFYRSLHWVCYDLHAPNRIVIPGRNVNVQHAYYDVGRVFHMGYAQSPGIIAYKQAIHGHKAEWLPYWYKDRFLDWLPGVMDVHPVIHDWWNPVAYVDDGSLQQVVGDHPYWSKEIIT